MATAPANSISLPLKHARDQLATCAAFQTWVGAASAQDALNHIYINGLPAPANGNKFTRSELESYRPMAILFRRDSRFSMVAGGDRHHFAQSGTLQIEFEENVDSDLANDQAEVEIQFSNTIGAIIDDFLVLSGLAGYLAVTEVDVPEFVRTDEDAAREVGDAMLGVWRFAWADVGMEGGF